MPPDDSTPDVDFVAHDDVDPGGFEELPQPAERPGLRRWRIPLVIAGVLVLAAVVVLAIVTHKPPVTPAAAPSDTVPTAPSTITVTLDPVTGRSVPDRTAIHLAFLDGLSAASIAAARGECPRLAPTCVTTGEAPTDVLHAVRSAFPRARHLIVLSDVAYQTPSGRSLAYRRVSARSGTVRIAIEIRAPRPSDAAHRGLEYHDRMADVFDEIRSRGLTVDVQISAPLPLAPSLRVVHALAADPRLLAIG